MDRFGYSRKLSAGLVAIGGTLGILIPPSVPLIIYGILTQQAIGKLFVAGIVPGGVICLLFIALILLRCRINPAIAPAGERFGWKDRFRSLSGVIWPLLIFFIVMEGLLQGFFTPTEAASVGTFSILVLSLLRRDIGKAGVIKSVGESLLTAAMVLFLIAGSTVLGHFLAVTKIPMFVSDWVVNLPLPGWAVMALVCVIYLIGGSFIDDLAVTKTPFAEIYKGVYPFLMGLIGCAILLFIFPKIALFLPDLLYK
jgi:tripartite ATP-independent transporter DctM subunit